METKPILLSQIPVITHALAEVGANVTARLSALNLDGQIATVETVQALKNLRAELNKELTDFETQRKAIKAGVNNPYLEFEAVYKLEVSDKYTAGIEKLKDKIASVEDKIKAEKRDAVQAYFKELCVSENVDFLTFENLGLEINLTVTEKKYKEQVNEFVTKVLDDICLIKTNEFEAEIMVEYKATLNVSRSIKDVQDRKEKERQEKERIRLQELYRRKNVMVGLGFVYEDMTQSYEYNIGDENLIAYSLKSIEAETTTAFANKVVEFEEKIKVLKASKVEEVAEQGEPTQTATATTAAAPLEAPKVQSNKEEEIFSACFEVSGSKTQLKALGQYMKDNNITYNNI